MNAAIKPHELACDVPMRARARAKRFKIDWMSESHILIPYKNGNVFAFTCAIPKAAEIVRNRSQPQAKKKKTNA